MTMNVPYDVGHVLVSTVSSNRISLAIVQVVVVHVYALVNLK